MSAPDQHTQPKELSLTAVLAALQATVPISALLFDATGRVLWVSGPAAQRFGLVTARRDASCLVTGDLEALDTLRQIALQSLERPAHQLEEASPITALLRPHERIEIKRFRDLDHAPLILVRVTNSSAPLTVDDLRRKGLSAREAEVAILATRGCSVVSIAAELEVKVTSARTYLKRAYKKLGVRSRAELAYLLLKPLTIDPPLEHGIRKPSCTRPQTFEKTSKSK